MPTNFTNPQRFQKQKLTPEIIYTLDSLWKLEKTIIDTMDSKQIVDKVAEKILSELQDICPDYRFVSLCLVNQKEKALKHQALAQSSDAPLALKKIEIPFNETKNICIKTIKENSPNFTYSLADIFDAKFVKSNKNEIEQIQKLAKINLCVVFPLSIRGEVVGVMIYGLGRRVEEITDLERSLIQYFSNLISIAVQNSRLYTNLEAETHQLVEANLTLRKLDKLKDEFISLTSHELRTPMTVIKSYLWLLENGKGGPLNDKQKLYVQKAVNGASRMIALINDMLNVSKIEHSDGKIKTEKINVKDMVKETVSEFEAKAHEKGLKLNFIADKDAEYAYADPDRLKEVVSNLISNAVKYTKMGKVDVTLGRENDRYVKVSVIDTGKGIEKQDIAKLFNKFGRVENSFRTVAEAEGTGLGLYIVKKLVEGMGGQVDAVSNGEGQGSAFWFTLSRYKASGEKSS